MQQKAKTVKEDEVTQNISREELKEKMDRGDEFFLVLHLVYGATLGLLMDRGRK